MAYEEFDGELDKPGAGAKGGFVEFDGELDKPGAGKKAEAPVPQADDSEAEPNVEQQSVGGDLTRQRQRMPPELGRPRLPAREAGGGRGFVNEPIATQWKGTGPSVLDRVAGRPSPSGPERDLVGESVAPWEKARRAEESAFNKRMSGYSLKETPLAERIGGDIRQGLNSHLGTGGAAIVGGAVGGVAELGKLGTGALTLLGDVTGSEGLQEFGKGASQKAGAMQRAVMPQGEGIDKNVAGVFSSIVANAPTMVMGVGGQGAALKLMFGQTSLANYGELRSEGFQPLPSAAASVIHGGAEVLGERFGFREQTIAVKGLMSRMMRHGSSTDDMAKNAAKLMLKEIPGEELTTTIQFLNEKYGFAPRTPEATLTDYFKQLAETAITTMGQSGVVGGTPAVIDARRKVYKQAEDAINRAAGLLPKGPYRDAAENGLVVDPPLVTDPPATQRSKTVKIFENVAAESGVSAAAIKRAKESADGMPAQDVGAFLNDVLQALQRKGGVATPIAEHAAAALTAGAAVPLSPEESAQAKEALKPAAEQEEDLTGLADATPASALEEAAHAEPAATSKDGFQPFEKETGSLGIPRADMPQVKAEHRGAMVNFLNARGVAHQEETEVEANSLKPAQAQFSPEKVRLAAEFTGGDRAILVSSDGYVLDGHHQWLAKMRQKEPVRIIRLDAPIKKLIPLVHDFPSSFAQNASNEPAQPDVQPAPIVAPEPATGGGNQPAGSGRAVGLATDDPSGSGKPTAPPAPAPSVRADAPVGAGGRQDATLRPVAAQPAPAKAGPSTRTLAGAAVTSTTGRVIANVGTMPKAAKPLELRDNTDGTTTPWHEGHEVLDFESGDPLKIPAGTSDADAIKIVKGARPFGRNSKYFAVTSEAPTAPGQETPVSEPQAAPAPGVSDEKAPGQEAPTAPAQSPITQARNTLIDMRTQLEAQGHVVDARLEGRIKRQEKLIREMLAEEAAPAPTPEPEKINTTAPAEAAPNVIAWQMTRDAYTAASGESEAVHRASVERAIAAGRPVPANVLAEHAAAAPAAAPAPADYWANSSLNSHEHNGRADFKAGKPRELPSYYEQPRGGNAKAWLRGYDRAKQEATDETTVAQPSVDAPVDGEIQQPDTMTEAMASLERGDKIVRFPGSEFEERVWIAEVKKASGNTWVVKSKSADSPVTITKGPVGSDKRWGWGRGDAARKAIEGWTFEAAEPAKVEAKPEVAPPPATPDTLSDEKAFADDYAAFEGKTVEQPVHVAETGETMKLRMDAAKSLRALDARQKSLEALRLCLEKA